MDGHNPHNPPPRFEEPCLIPASSSSYDPKKLGQLNMTGKDEELVVF